MEVKTDSHQQRHVEVATRGGERIRVQIRDASGHLRPGPEVPVDELGAVSAAVISLVTRRS